MHPSKQLRPDRLGHGSHNSSSEPKSYSFTGCSSNTTEAPRVELSKGEPATPKAGLDDLVKGLQSDNALVRKRAAIALGRIGPDANSAIPALEKLLSDSDPDVLEAASIALEAIDNRAAERIAAARQAAAERQAAAIREVLRLDRVYGQQFEKDKQTDYT